MEYRPRWERILFLALILNACIMLAGASTWSAPAPVEEPEDLAEVAWVDASVEEVYVPNQPAVQTFPEIKFQPIEIPKFEMPALPEPVAVEKPVEQPRETAPPSEGKPVEPKSAENPEGKLKAVVKVYPKDLIEQLVASGAVKERVTINSGKVVLAVTIGIDGKVKNVEIRRGGGNDERGNIINLVAEAAAGSWVFEPYLDDDGKPKELKTQIEFKPEDF